MSEDLHDIDKLFKAALDKHEESPSRGVWQNVDKDLDKKKVASIYGKYKKLKWVAAALFIFSMGMAMYTWHAHVVNKQLVQNNISRKNKVEKENKDVKEETIDTGKKEVDSAEIKKSIAGETIKGGENRPAVLDTIDKIDRQNENKDIKKKSAAISNSFEAINNVTGKTRKQNNANLKSEGNVAKRETSTGKNDIAFSSTRENNKAAVQGDKGNDLADKNPPLPHPYSTADLSVIPSNTTDFSLNGVSTLSIENILKSHSTLRVASAAGKENSKIAKTIVKPLKKNALSLTLFASPDFIGRRIENDHPRFFENERNEIKKSEENKVSSTIGVLVNYSFMRNWSIESGLTFSHVITNIGPKQIYARPDERGNINYRFNWSAGYSYIPYNSGQPLRPGDSVKAMTSKNTLSYVNVPIGVRYYINKGKFTFTPGAGIAANFLTQTQLETALAGGPGNRPADVSPVGGVRPSYFNGSLSFGVNYNLNPRFALSFIPVSRFGLSSITNTGDANIKTYLNSLSFGAGLTIKL